jgi:hypothetical protein
MSEAQVKEVIKHELKHIQQAKEDRFYVKPSYTGKDMIVFNGKEVISVSAYSKVISDMGSKNTEKRNKAYNKYRKFGWEVEAYEAGNPFKD